MLRSRNSIPLDIEIVSTKYNGYTMETLKLLRFYFLFAFINIIVTHCLVAQDYRLLEGDIFIGSGPTFGRENVGKHKGVFILGYEPRVNVSDKVSISVRVESGIVQAENEFETYSSSFSSMELFGDYYLFSNLNKRVFIGLGAGIMGPPGRSNSFGFSPRLGVELENLRISVTYNQMPFLRDSPKYVGLTFGFNFGGKSKIIEP